MDRMPSRAVAPGTARTRRPGADRAWRDGPTPISTERLLETTEEAARALRAGQLPVPDRAPTTAEGVLLHRSRYVDLWLMKWTGSPFVELHDHGGSLGALTVLDGELVEWHWSPGSLRTADTAEEAVVGGAGPRRRVLRAGDSTAFPLGHVHDISSRTPGARSVHAYSPPLCAMSYYRQTAGGLWRDRTELAVDTAWGAAA